MTIKKNIVGIRQAHNRIENAKGKAILHKCIKCGDPAVNWCHQKTKCDENTILYDVRGKFKTGYCLDIDCYKPMCRFCHLKMDGIYNRISTPNSKFVMTSQDYDEIRNIIDSWNIV